MRKKLLIGVILVVVIIGVFIGSFKGASNLGFMEFVKKTLKTDTVTKPADKGPTDSNATNKKNEPIIMMHNMANSLIVDEVWEVLPMNKKNIDELIAMLNKTEDFKEKATLIVRANNWKKGDFTNIIEDHNIVWRLLGGTIGKATGIDKDAVAEAVINMK